MADDFRTHLRTFVDAITREIAQGTTPKEIADEIVGVVTDAVAPYRSVLEMLPAVAASLGEIAAPVVAALYTSASSAVQAELASRAHQDWCVARAERWRREYLAACGVGFTADQAFALLLTRIARSASDLRDGARSAREAVEAAR